jgi:nucleoside-diphosphate-sugar epimerase
VQPYPPSDITEILDRSELSFRALAGGRVFVTGGTGFIGSWLVRALLAASPAMSLDLHLDLLVRDESKAKQIVPDVVADKRVELVIGDVTQRFPATPRPDFIIHAATTPTVASDSASQTEAQSAIESGMVNLVDHVRDWAGARVLFTSSGAVYGIDPESRSLLSEDDPFVEDQGAPNGYRDGKRAAELTLLESSVAAGFDAVVARLFAFVGPGLPLDAHFASGNFIRDALAGGPLRLSSDGSNIRSYQYPVDMVVWLLALLTRGAASRIYNVGSDVEVTIAQLAYLVAGAVDPPVSILFGPPCDPGSRPHRYVPSTARIESELGLRNLVDIDEAIDRTLQFHSG